MLDGWFQVGMLTASAIFVFVLLVYVVAKSDKRDKEDYFFSLLCMIGIIMIVSEIPDFICTGRAELWCVGHLVVSTFLRFFFLVIMSLVFTNYLACYLRVETAKKKCIRVSMALIGFAYELFIIFNLQFGYIYYYDDASKSIVYGPLGIVPQVFMLIPYGYDVYLFIKYRNNVFRSAWVGTAMYILLPFAGSIVEMNFRMPCTYVSMAIGLFSLFFNVKSEQAYRFEKQRKELAESRISIMLSQIQPHFMYNSLTTIAALCEKDPQEAKRATMNFSRYLRHNVDSVNKRMVVPFTNELEHVQTYLELEKLRFGDRLNVIIDVKARDFLIPPLTVQPLAENAVKHGICNKADGKGTLIIASEEFDTYYEIRICDDGVGFDTNKKFDDGREHIGMANVRERLATMSNATLTIESKPGEGTCITVHVPKKDTSARKKMLAYEN